MVNDNDDSWRKLKTVHKSTEVVEALAELGGAGVTEIASHVGISKSSAHAHLATLHEASYLTKEDGTYSLSFQFLLLGEFVRNKSALFQFGRRKINELATDTGHYAHLFIEENGLGVNIYEARGRRAGDYEYQSLKLQQREPLHVTASGKVILAHLPERRVKEIIETHGLKQYTKQTITSVDALFDELEEIREQGYAINDEEEIHGFRAVAAPIAMEDGNILGSVSVSGPVTFLKNQVLHQEIPEKVTDAAGIIQVNISMSQTSESRI